MFDSRKDFPIIFWLAQVAKLQALLYFQHFLANSHVGQVPTESLNTMFVLLKSPLLMVKSYGPFCLGIQQGSTHIINDVELSVSDNLDKWEFPKSWLEVHFMENPPKNR